MYVFLQYATYMLTRLDGAPRSSITLQGKEPIRDLDAHFSLKYLAPRALPAPDCPLELNIIRTHPTTVVFDEQSLAFVGTTASNVVHSWLLIDWSRQLYTQRQACTATPPG